MKYGTNKSSIRRRDRLIIPIGVDGIGEESHPTMKRNDDPQYWKTDVDEFNNRFIDLVKSKVEMDGNSPEEIEKPSKLKLYLNTVINLLFNRKKKSTPHRPGIRIRITSNLVRWGRKETTQDVWDLIKFVLIHGLLGAPFIISLLTFTDININLIQYIRNETWLQITLYIIELGSR